MRKILFLAFVLVSTITFSQAPQFLNYQGIARDATGNVINAGSVGLKFEIIQGSTIGTVVYKEENSSSPSSAGIFTTAIGSGTAVVGSFTGINWAGGPYFIRVSLDPTGGTVFNTVGTSQLMSVPYALYAETAGNATTFAAGNGITINSGTITNSAPNQTVNISGPGVLGSYPNYTVTSGATPTAGTGISIVSGTITNTAPDQTVTISGATGTYPNFTVNPTPATTITPGNSNISVSGVSPSYTISSVPTLSLSGAQLSISNGNTVTLPTGTTYTNGPGIALTSGTIITNTAPNQTVTVSNGTNVTVNGTYPNYTVNAVPTLSLAGNNLSISGGNTVTLPAPPTLTAGAGISISAGIISNTAPNQTVNVTGAGVSGIYPNYTVTSSPATTVTAGNNMNVSGVAPTYTVSTPTYSLNFSNSSTGLLTNGISNSAVSLPQPTLTIGGAGNNVISAGSNSITIANYTAGNGLLMSGAFPSFTLSTNATGTNVAWNTLGNAGTIATSNFIGTTDNIPFNIRVNNQKSGRIDHLLANAFFGYQAGNANTTGIFNTAFGNQTLLSNTTGSYNAAFGTNALYFNTSGINNSATGYQPLYSNTTGNNNTANGYQAGYSNSTGSGNVFLGYQAGYNALGSNKLYIANSNANPPLIYGDFSARMIGFGTITPLQQLHIFSSGTNVGLAIDGGAAGRARLGLIPGGVDNGEFGFRNDLVFGPVPDANLIMGTEFMRLTGGGKLGIGTTAPASLLHVNGAVTITDGSQGDGLILVSNPGGTSTWKKGSKYAYYNPSSTSISNLSPTATVFPGVSYTYTKGEAGTTLEIEFSGHVTASGMAGTAGIIFELRVDGATCSGFSGHGVYWQNVSPNPQNIVLRAIAENLSAGNHTVEIWAYTNVGTTTSVNLNPGNWYEQIIVKETR